MRAGSFVMVLLLLLACFALGRCTAEKADPSPPVVVRDTVQVVRVDTLRDTCTRYVSERVVDTVRIEIPRWVEIDPPTLLRVQREYEGDNYRAWVSGCLDPSLDSIHIERDVIETTITIHEREKVKRWGLGVQAGATWNFEKGRPAPYIGVGVTYNLLTW